MKKDVKSLIKRLALLVQFKRLKKGWISIDGDGIAYLTSDRPYFTPSGISEALDRWDVLDPSVVVELTRLGNLPLSMVCPSLTSREALFYTDGETVWLVETK